MFTCFLKYDQFRSGTCWSHIKTLKFHLIFWFRCFHSNKMPRSGKTKLSKNFSQARTTKIACRGEELEHVEEVSTPNCYTSCTAETSEAAQSRRCAAQHEVQGNLNIWADSVSKANVTQFLLYLKLSINKQQNLTISYADVKTLVQWIGDFSMGLIFERNHQIEYGNYARIQIGRINQVCQFCEALKCKGENPSMCCESGKLHLQLLGKAIIWLPLLPGGCLAPLLRQHAEIQRLLPADII